ncbi:MAG: glycosyltransferase family 1 protein [Propionibacteriaceae bacterium]|nr:glycosyltransferase family 1 protein [Propionibacteriaceae bacterium]
MRVAIVAESFLPQVNGVTNSVLRVAEHLRDGGHEAIIVAPDDHDVPSAYAGFDVVTVAAVSFPLYNDVKIGLTPSFVLERLLADWAPDVVHLAAPFAIGHNGLLAAARLSLPTVAIYQTDIPSYTSRYGFGFLEPMAWAKIRDMHNLATLTLAPSRYARDQLMAHGIPRVAVWGRGVDTARFNPAKRDPRLHARWAPQGETVVGYMGRLAPEKQVSDLTVLADLPGVRLVVVGDGPSRKALTAQLPQARFTGRLEGEDLTRAIATMDVFVHPGELETFGQAVQEALASGLPVVAPARGGPIDLVRPGRTGYLYPPGQLGQLRRQVERLVADPGRRRDYGRRARAFVTRRTWAHLCDQLLDHYRDAMHPWSEGAIEADPR